MNVHSFFENGPNMIEKTQNRLFQVGILSSFIHCAYEGDVMLSDVLENGDTGLGTINGVDGNIVINNGIAYHLDFDGNASKADNTKYTPFCVSAFLNTKHSFELSDIGSFAHLAEEIRKTLPSKNYIYLFKINGVYNKITMRGEKVQPKPYLPLSKTILTTQRIFSLEQVQGTMIGSLFPDYLKHINLNDFHFHFISEDEKKGGHVHELSADSLEITVAIVDNINLHFLNNNTWFSNEDFSIISKKEMETVQKGE
jgi:acetolactate decarboxylase